MKKFFKKYGVNVAIWTSSAAFLIGFVFLGIHIITKNSSFHLDYYPDSPSIPSEQSSIDSAEKSDSIQDVIVIKTDSIDRIEKHPCNND